MSVAAKNKKNNSTPTRRRDRVRPEGWNWRRSETTDINRVAADHRDGKDVALRPETDLESCLKDLLYGADLNFLLRRPRALAGPMGRVAGGSARKEKFTFYRPSPRPRAPLATA